MVCCLLVSEVVQRWGGSSEGLALLGFRAPKARTSSIYKILQGCKQCFWESIVAQPDNSTPDSYFLPVWGWLEAIQVFVILGRRFNSWRNQAGLIELQHLAFGIPVHPKLSSSTLWRVGSPGKRGLWADPWRLFASRCPKVCRVAASAGNHSGQRFGAPRNAEKWKGRSRARKNERQISTPEIALCSLCKLIWTWVKILYPQ